MKIDVNSPVVSQLTTDRTTTQVPKEVPTVGSGSTEDRTTLHSDSASVQSLTSQALQSPEVRQDKVDQLRLAVTGGDYKPDATETASAILESEGH
jgi:flagellar biosynthesis anti-sigma factor FlgM